MFATRFAMLAMMAIALSLGGYRVGAMTHLRTDPSLSPDDVLLPKISAEIPSDHPISIALKRDDLQLAPEQRKELEEAAIEFTQRRGQIDRVVQGQQQERLQQLSRAKAALEEQIDLLSRQIKALSGAKKPASAKDRAAFESKVRSVMEAHNSVVKKLDSAVEEISRAEKELHKGKGSKKATIQQLQEARATIVQFESKSDTFAFLQKKAAERHLNETYASVAFKILDPQAGSKVRQAVRLSRTLESSKGFALIVALANRDLLGLSPHQVTQLQLLQADFIRDFAPLREMFELSELPMDKGVANQLELVATKVEGMPASGRLELKGAPVTIKSSGVEILDAGKGQKRIRIQSPSETGAHNETLVVGAPIASTTKAATKVGKDAQVVDLVLEMRIVQSAKEIETKLRSLEKDYVLRAYKLLSADQQRRLKELVDQSLGSGQ